MTARAGCGAQRGGGWLNECGDRAQDGLGKGWIIYNPRLSRSRPTVNVGRERRAVVGRRRADKPCRARAPLVALRRARREFPHHATPFSLLPVLGDFNQGRRGPGWAASPLEAFSTEAIIFKAAATSALSTSDGRR